MPRSRRRTLKQEKVDTVTTLNDAARILSFFNEFGPPMKDRFATAVNKLYAQFGNTENFRNEFARVMLQQVSPTAFQRLELPICFDQVTLKVETVGGERYSPLHVAKMFLPSGESVTVIVNGGLASARIDIKPQGVHHEWVVQ
jgi:hypothetical protein